MEQVNLFQDWGRKVTIDNILLKELSGIYQIKNIINNKSYIGSSTNILKRVRRHSTVLRHNKHINKYLQNAVNKYGQESFIFELLECCNIDNLIEREQHYMDTLKPQYNLRPLAENNSGYVYSEEAKAKMRGRKLSPETCAKMSIARKGRKFDEETIKKISESNKLKKLVSIIQYSKEGDFIKIWPSLISIERELGYKVHPGLRLDRIRCGYYWKYHTENYALKVDVPIYIRPKVIKGKRIIIDNGKEQLEFINMVEAAKYLNREDSSVGYAYKHGTKTNGYYVRDKIAEIELNN